MIFYNKITLHEVFSVFILQYLLINTRFQSAPECLARVLPLGGPFRLLSNAFSQNPSNFLCNFPF